MRMEDGSPCPSVLSSQGRSDRLLYPSSLQQELDHYATQYPAALRTSYDASLRRQGQEFYMQFPWLRGRADFDHHDTKLIEVGSKLAQDIILELLAQDAYQPLPCAVHLVYGRHDDRVRACIRCKEHHVVDKAVTQAYAFLQFVLKPLFQTQEPCWGERLANAAPLSQDLEMLMAPRRTKR